MSTELDQVIETAARAVRRGDQLNEKYSATLALALRNRSGKVLLDASTASSLEELFQLIQSGSQLVDVIDESARLQLTAAQVNVGSLVRETGQRQIITITGVEFIDGGSLYFGDDEWTSGTAGDIIIDDGMTAEQIAEAYRDFLYNTYDSIWNVTRDGTVVTVTAVEPMANIDVSQSGGAVSVDDSVAEGAAPGSIYMVVDTSNLADALGYRKLFVAPIDGSDIQSASSSVPGVVTVDTQTFAGDKTFLGRLVASNQPSNPSANDLMTRNGAVLELLTKVGTLSVPGALAEFTASTNGTAAAAASRAALGLSGSAVVGNYAQARFAMNIISNSSFSQKFVAAIRMASLSNDGTKVKFVWAVGADLSGGTIAAKGFLVELFPAQSPTRVRLSIHDGTNLNSAVVVGTPTYQNQEVYLFLVWNPATNTLELWCQLHNSASRASLIASVTASVSGTWSSAYSSCQNYCIANVSQGTSFVVHQHDFAQIP